VTRPLAWLVLLGVLAPAGGLVAGTEKSGSGHPGFRLRLDPGSHARKQTPLSVSLDRPDSLGAAPHVYAQLLDANGVDVGVPVQVEPEGPRLELSWIEPELAANTPAYHVVLLKAGPAPGPVEISDGFHYYSGRDWKQLRYGDQPTWQEVFSFDPEHREETLRPYLHLFGFNDEGYVTKGSSGLYPAQRGLFLGWSKTEFAGASYDFWTCSKVMQRQGTTPWARSATGLVLAREQTSTDWLAPDGRVIARDTREYTTWHTPSGAVILDVSISIEAPGGPIRLDGDPQHGGLHFRAVNEVRDHAVETYFVKSRGTQGGKNDIWDRANWLTMVFRVGKHTYALTDMCHPSNPGPTRFATRDYGRIGTFFAKSVEPGTPLSFRNRFLLTEVTRPNQVTVQTEDAHYSDFADPVKIKID